MQTTNVIRFAPHLWGELDRFAHLHQETYRFNEFVQGCIGGAASHFHRARLLREHAVSLVPAMAADRQELEATGQTAGRNSGKVAAIVESALIALYSSVDAARKVVTVIYKNHQGLPESTRRTFVAAREGKIDPKVPAPIRDAFANATWYFEVRQLRDAIIHMGVGSCHLDPATGLVFYLHDALREGTQTRRVPDMFAQLAAWEADVNRFLGQVFRALNGTLKDDEVWQMCGVFGSRIYHRYVRPSEAVDFHGGRCDAHTWFDQPGQPRCPFVEKCGAYERRRAASP